jgi:D-alanyl-D-alanine carboxypeptidase (penicillin-binding protein 5/6)
MGVTLVKTLGSFGCSLALALGILLPQAVKAQGFETQAGSAYVVDHNSGQVLFALNADVPLPPASMSKLMTLNMTFEALEDGRLTLDTALPVSEHAMSFGGSTMFLNTTDRVRVEDLIRGIVVLSGNDATVVLAEALSPDGTEAGFAALMTERARQLGMETATFRNASGWPAAGHVISMRDLGILAERLITEFPQYYHYFNEREFPFDNRAPDNRFNRNPILGLGIGADGLKTGHTEEAGYGLVGSAVQGDRRVTFVISGLPTADARAGEAERIVNWAFRQFVERDVIAAGDILTQAPVFLGETPTVPLTVADDVRMLLPQLTVTGGLLQAEVTLSGPIPAPIAAGMPLGELHIAVEGLALTTVPLIAATDVAQAGIMGRLGAATSRAMAAVMGQVSSLSDN